MLLSIIVAMDKNRAIGKDNKLPWKLKNDLENFKRHTLHKPILMGRKTFESIGRPLPNRENIVITSRRDYFPEGVIVFNDILPAISYLQNKETEEAMFIGGESIYRQLFFIADKIYLTEVDTEVEGADTFFPNMIDTDYHNWIKYPVFKKLKDEDDEYDWTFTILEKDREPCGKLRKYV